MVKNTPGPEPHRAIYGFSFNLFFTSLFALYVIWVLPYQAFGFSKHFYFVPDTYFAFSLPVFVLCGIVFFLFLYLSVNMAQTANIESSLTFKDTSKGCKCEERNDLNDSDSEADEDEFSENDNLCTSTSFAVDVDLSHVSRVLYNKN
ncbi:phosphatidylinositol N-acetylglucosaminyltransferase subunit P [Episyrphus balteatus]|uniref:phosphatidylinositol N-acetylglucosaminyltransferase subunit P n=1 Tax=Episyrphus balteatus TaxID=286459 RepID=UPI002485F37A|nr:phosphatidylinositol N-acetylglucosaminyltransferase subunit P [Episyrphus balteatus]XP_055848965.1 phosphatidylinositol N-acetylglucosaminyltransferase subunit P [Episyrphus balteatus]